MGNTEAIDRLTRVSAEEKASKFMNIDFEARLALGKIQADWDAAAASRTLFSLEEEARTAGFFRVMRKAVEARSLLRRNLG
jgi:hypothetical protein